MPDVVSASISNETNCSCVAVERKLSQAMNMIDSLKIGLTGDTAPLSGRTCRDIVQKRPRAPNGVYWISQGENSAPYRVFCDMTTDGGGWTLVTVIKAINGNDEKEYPVNGMNEENLLADRVDDWASLSRVKMNAIHNWHNDSILRVYHGISDDVLSSEDKLRRQFQHFPSHSSRSYLGREIKRRLQNELVQTRLTPSLQFVSAQFHRCDH